MRAMLRIGVLVSCVLAAACAGDDSTLTLLRIGPAEGIPQTRDATLIIIGRDFPSGNLTLEVMGVGSFPCEVKGTATALCFVPANTLPNSASYIDSWKRVLRADTKLVVQAASAGQKAADYILGVS